MENTTFCYSYSAKETKEVERIRRRYTENEPTKIEELRRLDSEVQGAGMIESLCLGIVGILIFGVAMCFGLGVFGAIWWPAIPIGLVSLAVMLPAYPLYKRIYNKKKEELTPEILKLSEELMGK